MQAIIRWFKHVMHTPSRVLAVLESVHKLDHKVDELERRLRKVETDVLHLPVPKPTDLSPVHRRIDVLHQHLDSLAFIIGTMKAGDLPAVVDQPSDAEFKIFSQFGDDGIIEFLVKTLNIQDRKFVEFGVESYVESNTRFLMLNRNWSGLIIDGSDENIDWIKSQDYYWRHDLTAVSAFIDADNINDLLAGNGFSGPIGLLSIDIDGNDYWVWKAISCVDPIIVVCEFNAIFGPNEAVTVPYDPSFQRTSVHHSNLYWGASLSALHALAVEKGYSFVGCNSAGNNAYFVRNSHLGRLKALNPAQGFVNSKFRESRDEHGRLLYSGPDERREIIADMEVFDLHDFKLRPVKGLSFDS